MTNVFDTEYCIVCFIKFCVPAGFTNQRRKDCAAFYCPNGHRMAYNKTDTEESRLRRERDLLKQQLAEKDDAIRIQREAREAAERSAVAARGQVTKLKKRASAGVCPCCSLRLTMGASWSGEDRSSPATLRGRRQITCHSRPPTGVLSPPLLPPSAQEAMISTERDIPEAYEIGDQVEKFSGEYRALGDVRTRFTTKRGAVRYVVEHEAEGGGSFCHIYSGANLRLRAGGDDA